MRWLNNCRWLQQRRAPGPCPRPSLAALDPATGLPYSWNPGRHPRGRRVCRRCCSPTRGCSSAATPTTSGNQAYLRPRIAFLPLSTGSTLPTTTPPAAPDVYRAGATAGGRRGPTTARGAAGADFMWPTTSQRRRLVRGAWRLHGRRPAVDRAGGRQPGAADVRRRDLRDRGRVAAVGRPCLVRSRRPAPGVAEVYLGAASSLAERAPRRDGPDVLRRAALLHPQRQHAPCTCAGSTPRAASSPTVRPSCATWSSRRPRPGCSSRGRRSTWPGYDGTLSRRPLLGQTCRDRRRCRRWTWGRRRRLGAAVLFSGVGPAVP